MANVNTRRRAPHCCMSGDISMARTVAFFILVALSSEVLAQGPAQLGFDWRKHPTPGDVTVAISQNQRDNAFHIGPGRITLTASITLLQATLNEDSLTLKFEVHDPKQTVQFADLQGASGDYKPAGWKARRITISNSSHTERFVRKGVLTLNVRKSETRRRAGPRTPEERLPSLLPGPETGYTPRSLKFAQLAAAVSAMYKMPGRDTFRPVDRAKLEAARAAAAYPDPKLQQYANKMLGRVKADQNIDVQAVRRQLIARAKQLAQQTLKFGSVKSTYTNSDGSTRNIYARGNEPDPAAQSEARKLSALASGSDGAIREYIKQQRNQNTFSDLLAGDGISNNLAHLYQNILIDSYKILSEDAKKAAGPKSAACLITVLRPDSSTPTLRNVSGKKLTDVVVFSGWGFTRSEKQKSYGHLQFVFIPVWKPNEEVELQKIQLREPSVMHAKVNVYANEASSEDHAFSLVDPRDPPSNKPGAENLRTQQAIRALQLARQALAQKNKQLAVRYLKQAVAASPDSPAGKSAQKLLVILGN